MSKKPVPGLMGNVKFPPGSSMQEVKVGARRITRFVQPGDNGSFQSALDADSLFGGGFGDVDIFVLEHMLQEAGFPEYPETITVSEREAIAERFTGAAPNIENPKDIPASLAWVLVQFSMAENLRQFYISSNDLGGVWSAGVRMGRLAEWWVWRSKGYDVEAVHGRSFSGKTTDAAKKGHTKKGKERAQHVIEFAQRVLDQGGGRFASGKINQRNLARQYLAIVKPRIKEDRVRQIIGAAIRDRKLV